MTAIGKDGNPVPIPISVRLPLVLFVRRVFRNAVVLATTVLAFGMISGLVYLKQLRPFTAVAPGAVLAALFWFVFELAIYCGSWPCTRRKIGRSLEEMADGWSLSELDMHVRNVQAQAAKATGHDGVLYSRHLLWLEARRERLVRSFKAGRH
jgi:hypothetical protein